MTTTTKRAGARWRWLLLGAWLAYSGGALAWLHLNDPPPAGYCISRR